MSCVVQEDHTSMCTRACGSPREPQGALRLMLRGAEVGAWCGRAVSGPRPSPDGVRAGGASHAQGTGGLSPHGRVKPSGCPTLQSPLSLFLSAMCPLAIPEPSAQSLWPITATASVQLPLTSPPVAAPP